MMKVTITGVDDVAKVLSSIAPNEARNLMRSTVTDMAKQLAVDGRNNSPADEGTMRAAIRHERRNQKGENRNIIRATVLVGRLAFYWRFLEYGQGPDGVEHGMFLKAIQKMSAEMDRVFLATFVKKLTARLARVNKARGG